MCKAVTTFLVWFSRTQQKVVCASVKNTLIHQSSTPKIKSNSHHPSKPDNKKTMNFSTAENTESIVEELPELTNEELHFIRDAEQGARKRSIDELFNGDSCDDAAPPPPPARRKTRYEAICKFFGEMKRFFRREDVDIKGFRKSVFFFEKDTVMVELLIFCEDNFFFPPSKAEMEVLLDSLEHHAFETAFHPEYDRRQMVGFYCYMKYHYKDPHSSDKIRERQYRHTYIDMFPLPITAAV